MFFALIFKRQSDELSELSVSIGYYNLVLCDCYRSQSVTQRNRRDLRHPGFPDNSMYSLMRMPLSLYFTQFSSRNPGSSRAAIRSASSLLSGIFLRRCCAG